MRKFVVLLCAISTVSIPTTAQNAGTLLQRITQVTSRPIFKHSTFGVEVYDLTANKILVAMNQEKLFNSGSTTKLVTEGTALALLGENYRFHTRVYYNGSITPDGTLDGDLVLVASGDTNLSARVRPDDTLAFTSSDHAYAGPLPGKSVPGDPLRVLKELAAGVLMKGIWRIRGNVIVDASLFPSNQVEPGTHTTISPVVLNDNVIDVIATPARSAGGPVSIEAAPALTYLKVINRVRTGGPESDPELQFTSDITEADGSHTVVLEGSVPAGVEKAQAAYKVKDPVLFATEAFREALRWANIVLEAPAQAIAPASISKPYSKSNMLTEHVSPPFKEDVKITLKASQNLHAATTPYLLGAILAHGSSDAFQKGLWLEKRFLTDAGLDPESVSQLDGEGGIGSAFSPDFMVRFLMFMSRQSYGQLFFDSLPVLGRDGTLAEIMTDSPAVGHVHAKTGSYVVSNALNKGVMLLGKGLVGYVDATNGHRLIFAAYVNLVPLHNMDDVAEVGEMLAEIAVSVYQDAPPKAVGREKPRSPWLGTIEDAHTSKISKQPE
jgi:D-alanyl-D-alanine carboxypeptidase/D-alanyl-D-alanine-endopeptidase (penicillin-binding protein 4)